LMKKWNDAVVLKKKINSAKSAMRVQIFWGGGGCDAQR